MASHRRGPWSPTEDQYLMSLVHTQGPLNWVRIAQTLGSRTPKQCRERYHQNLKPNLRHDPITPEEGQQIERMVQEIGKRWAEIARQLNGRSDNAVKNWWNGSQNRRKRLDRRRVNYAAAPSYDGHHHAIYNKLQVSLSPPQTQPVLSPPYYRHGQYGIEPPLLSPSASEPASDEGMDGVPSLISDCGSSYTTSPRGLPSLLSSTIELPPLKSIGSLSPPTATGDSKLPGLYHLAPEAAANQRRLPPFSRLPEEKDLGGSQLPTAPNSPVALPPRLPPISRSQESTHHGVLRDSRMHLSSLLA